MHEVIETDFVPLRSEITTRYDEGSSIAVKMHDGSVVRLRKVADEYDPTDRVAALDYLSKVGRSGEVPTGLLYVEESGGDMHDVNGTVDTPLVSVPYESLCPGNDALAELQKEWW
jgi:2-oxoglutarate ferredoxin oxidoreductase subunit beta